jgi:glucose-fructose oxidoreductase
MPIRRSEPTPEATPRTRSSNSSRSPRSSRSRTRRPAAGSGRDGPVRFAVVGLGYFAQVAVLPAFKRAKGVELVALVSDDSRKLKQLGEQYDVPLLATYDSYDELLASGGVDAVYICLPNDLHEPFTVRAARHKVHVLCEKPLAVTSEECRRMVDACRRNRVRLMTAYRLHFNAANLEAARLVQEEIGTPRYFTSSFSMQVRPGIRTRGEDRGGGPLYDIGIYCINAARYLFREEPTWVQASAATGQRQARFRAIDEQVTCILGFKQGKTATFTASYGAADVACYSVVGTKGFVSLDNAYEHSTGMTLEAETDGRSRTRRYLKRDQIAPELEHFAQCVRDGTDPEPSGKEGLIDVAIIEAIQRAVRSGRRVPVRTATRRRRPTPRLEMNYLPHRRRRLVNAKVPFQE